MHFHPQLDDKGNEVPINHPSSPSALEAWDNPAAIATVVPGGAMPKMLNGIEIETWADAPQSAAAWKTVARSWIDMPEPTFALSNGEKASAGAVVVEPDGRIWLMSPTNGYGGYFTTFPKGRPESGISLQVTAIRETFEEIGLRIEITGFLCDTERSTTIARYYLARRLGGNPADMGWEAQATHLVPVGRLHELLTNSNDAPIIKAIQQQLS